MDVVSILKNFPEDSTSVVCFNSNGATVFQLILT
jgi:hypothetical protein